jgi:calcineurin-like phosphoesterase family protein
MSRLKITSDLHLGHRGICKYRTNFSTPEEHDAVIFDNLASSVTKRDTLFLLGDIAFTLEWHHRISDIKCKHKVIILGNHDTDRSVRVAQFAHLYDRVHGLLSHRNHWWSHCPIHPQEMRGRKGNIHGHLHAKLVQCEYMGDSDYVGEVDDRRYLNACVEHTSWFPISFENLTGDN